MSRPPVSRPACVLEHVYLGTAPSSLGHYFGSTAIRSFEFPIPLVADEGNALVLIVAGTIPATLGSRCTGIKVVVAKRNECHRDLPERGSVLIRVAPNTYCQPSQLVPWDTFGQAKMDSR